MVGAKPDDCSRRTLILEHERDAGAGLLAAWLESREFRLDVARTAEGDTLPEVDAFDFLVVLGSARCAIDNLPWIALEADLIRTAHLRGTPVFGICFGGQLLARTLGGQVFRDRANAVGWVDIDSRRPEVITKGPWFEWHFDTFDAPPDAEILATSDSGVEAFQLERSLGVQFHPEVDRETMDAWIAGDREGLERGGTDGDRLIAEMGEESLTERTNRLFHGIGRNIGLV